MIHNIVFTDVSEEYYEAVSQARTDFVVCVQHSLILFQFLRLHMSRATFRMPVDFSQLIPDKLLNVHIC